MMSGMGSSVVSPLVSAAANATTNNTTYTLSPGDGLIANSNYIFPQWCYLVPSSSVLFPGTCGLQAAEHYDLVNSGLPSPPALSAPLVPADALNASQANSLDVTTTDPGGVSAANAAAFLNGVAPPDPTPVTDYSWAYWLVGGGVAVWLLGQYLGGGR